MINEGDRVYHVSYGEGVVVHYDNPDWVGVRFDIPGPDFHNCWGKCENRHGFYVNPDELSLSSSSLYEDMVI